MKSVKDDQVPTTPEEREKYFMSHVEKGEQFCTKGVSTLLGRTGGGDTYPAPKGPSLLSRLRWRSLGRFGFIPRQSS
jgi:MAS20 protein import receptor